MKKLIMILHLFFISLHPIHADETIVEKIESTANDTKRATKMVANRMSEKLCTKDDLECAAEKAKNRVIEAKDATVDAAKEAKNIVD